MLQSECWEIQLQKEDWDGAVGIFAADQNQVLQSIQTTIKITLAPVKNCRADLKESYKYKYKSFP